MTKQAAITGANGHIGATLVRELEAHAYTVKGLVRPGSDQRGLQGTACQVVEGDVLKPDSLAPLVENCDIVFHCAAVYSLRYTDPSEIIKPAIEGARHIFAAARAANVRRVVYTSSIAAIGFADHPGALRDEEHWNDTPFNAYYVAKTDSERIAHELADEYGIELVVVNPAMVIGPYDFRVTPSSKFVLEIAGGSGLTTPGALNVVDVRDVATLHRLAAESGRPGERYIAGGINQELRQFGNILGDMVGKRPHYLPLPRGLALALISFMAGIERLFGKNPTITRNEVEDIVGRYAVFDTTKARTELGWQARTLDDTLRDTLAWFIHSGQLDPNILHTDASALSALSEWPPA